MSAICDSLIFDMDGTLWDAVDSYCTIWNTTFASLGLDFEPVNRDTLLQYMGMHLEDIVAALCKNVKDKDEFLRLLDHNERTMMPVLGGRLYPDVMDTIKALSKRYRLFMVSNCGSHGLENFLDFTGLRPYITEALSHGGTGLSKAENISALVRQHHLKRPYYVGDTAGDVRAAAQAGIGMIFCAYGFGSVDKPEITIDCFKELEQVVTPSDAATID